MFEGIASHYLSKALSKYISNYDRSRLDISLTKGKVELRDLLLRPDALDDLNLPLTVIAGSLGKLTINVSWTSLLSSPLVVEIDRILLLVGPGGDHPYDAEKEAELAKQEKQRLLQEYADKLEKALARSRGEAVDDDADNIFSSKSIFRIVNNVQIKIGAIHIRYEDTGASSNKPPLAVGITLHGLNIASADDNWKPAPIGTSPTVARKTIDLDRLGMYWDSGPSLQLLSSLDAAAALQSLAAIFSSPSPSNPPTAPAPAPAHNYIIDPITAHGRATINKDCVSRNVPQQEIELDFPQLSLTLSNEHYRDLLSAADYMAWQQLRSSFRHLRPAQPVAAQPRRWWRFAFNAVLVDYRRRHRVWSWTFLRNRRDQRAAYIALYTKVITKARLSSDDKASLAALEDALDVSDIILYRRRAQAQLPPASAAAPKSFFGRWFGGDSKKTASTSSLPRTESGSALALEAETKKYLALLDAEQNYQTPESKAYIGTRACIRLGCAAVTLRQTAPAMVLLHAQIDHSELNLHQRPVADALAVDFRVPDLAVQVADDTSRLRPILVRAPTPHPHPPSPSPASKPVFAFAFETNPLVEAAGQFQPDARLNLSLLPLEIDLAYPDIQRVQAFFTPPEGARLDDLSSMVSATMADIKAQTRAGLEYAIESRKTLDVSVDVDAPLVILASSAPTPAAPHPPRLCVDLGHFRLRSTGLEAAAATDLRTSSLATIEKLAYDAYSVEVDDIVVLLAADTPDWRTHVTQPTSEHHLVNKTGLTLALQHCLRSKDANLPELKVDLQLRRLQLQASDRQLSNLDRFLGCLSAPPPANALPMPKPSLGSGDSVTRPTAAAAPAPPPPLRPRLDADTAMYRDLLSEVDRTAAAAPRARPAPLALSDDDDSDEFVDASSQPPTPSSASSSSFVLAPEPSPSPSTSATLAQLPILLEATVLVSHVSILLQQHVPGMGNRAMLELQLDQLEAYVQQREASLILRTGLESVTVSEHLSDAPVVLLLAAPERGARTPVDAHPNPAAAPSSIAADKNAHFVHALVRQCQPSSAAFASDFNSTALAVDLSLSTMAVTAEQDALCRLLNALPSFLKVANSSKVLASSSSSADDAEPAEAAPTPAPAPAPTLPPNAHEMTISAAFQQLSLVVVTSQRDIAAIHISNLQSDIVQTGPIQTIRATLGDIEVLDLSTDATLYPKIVFCNQDAPETTTLLPPSSSSFIQADLRLDTRPDAEFATDVTISTGALHLIFLQRFVNILVESLNVLSESMTSALESGNADATPEPSSPTHPTPTSTSTPTPSKMKLNLHLRAPVIVVPRQSLSNSVLVADLGLLLVTNSYSSPSPSPTLVQRFCVDLKQLAMRRELTSDNGRTFTQPRLLMRLGDSRVEAGLRVLPPAQTPHCKVPELQVNCVLGDADIQLGRLDYGVIMATLEENFSEGSSMLGPEYEDNDDLGDLRRSDSDSSLDSMETASFADSEFSADESLPSLTAEEMAAEARVQALTTTQTPTPLARVLFPVLEDAGFLSPTSGPWLVATVEWRLLRVTLYEDVGCDPEAARADAAGLARIAISDLTLEFEDNPRHPDARLAAVRLSAISAEDVRQTSAKNHFPVVIESNPAATRNEALLTVDLKQHISAVRVVCAPTADEAAISAAFSARLAAISTAASNPTTTPSFQRADLHHTPERDLAIAFVHFNNLAGAALEHFVEDTKADAAWQRQHGFRLVDWAPPSATDVTCAFRGLSLVASLDFMLHLADFFLADTLKQLERAAHARETLGEDEATLAQHLALADDASELQASRSAAADNAILNTANAAATSTAAGSSAAASNLQLTSVKVPDGLEHLAVSMHIDKPSITLVADQYDPNPRIIVASVDAEVQVRTHGETQWVGAHLRNLSLHSTFHDLDAPRLEIVPCTSLNLMYTSKEEATRIVLDHASLALNLSYLDIRAVGKMLSSIQADAARRQAESGLVTWTQAVVPVTRRPPSEAPASSSSSRTATAQDAKDAVLSQSSSSSSSSSSAAAAASSKDLPADRREETLDFAGLDLDIQLVNNQKQTQSPLYAISANINGHLSNWSNDMQGNLSLQLAAAAFNPLHSMWEPLLLGSSAADTALEEPLPWLLDAKLLTAPSEWLDSRKEIKIAGECGKRYGSRYRHPGSGPAELMLDPSDGEQFWDSRAKDNIYVVFDFGRVVTLSRFCYTTIADGVHGPKESHLSVGTERKGPFTRVVDLPTTDKHAHSSFTPEFLASGRFWKWTITKTHGDGSAWVSTAQFKQHGGALSLALQAESRLELTLTSESIKRLSGLMDTWTADYDLGSSVDDKSRLAAIVSSTSASATTTTTSAAATTKEQPDSEAELRNKLTSGTHRLVNRTGFPVAFLQDRSFVPDDRIVQVADGNDAYFSFDAEESSDGDGERGLDGAVGASEALQQDDTSVPITDLTVLFPRKQRFAPKGYTVIRKNLSAGTHGRTVYLCYKRDPDRPPITDIWVTYGDAREDRLPEPLPDGFERISTDINSGTGGRDVYLDVRRGSGPPIVNLAVVFGGKHKERVPFGFSLLYKDINVGTQGGRIWLAVQRQPMALVASPTDVGTAAAAAAHHALPSDSPSDAPQYSYPISELKIIMCPTNKGDDATVSQLVSQVDRGDQPDLPWERLGMNVTSKAKGKRDIYLIYRRNPRLPPLTGLMATGTQALEQVDGGWHVLPENIKTGTRAQPLYLATRAQPDESPLLEARMFEFPRQPVPPGFCIVPSNLNRGTVGRPLYLALKFGQVPRQAWRPLSPEEAKAEMEKRLASIQGELAASARRASVHRRAKAEQNSRSSMLALRHLQLREHMPHYISLEVEGWAPLERIPVRKTGTEIFVLHRRWRSQRARLAVIVEQQDDLKIITVQSPLRIENHLGTDIEVGLLQGAESSVPNSDDPRPLTGVASVARMRPGQTLPLPIGLLDRLGGGTATSAFAPSLSPDLSSISATATTTAPPPPLRDGFGRLLRPLFRFWNVFEKRHFYSTDPLAIEQLGTCVVEQCLLGFILTQPAPGTVPLYAVRATDVGRSVVFHVTTNRAAITRVDRPKIKPLNSRQLAAQGMELVGHVYTEPIDSVTVPLYNYYHGEFRDIICTTEGAEEVGPTRKRERGRHHYLLDGLECHLLQAPGHVRFRLAGDDLVSDWSRETHNFLCSRDLVQRRLVFAGGRHPLPQAASTETLPYALQCEIYPATIGVWRLEPPLLARNKLPMALRVAVVSDPQAEPQPHQWVELAGAALGRGRRQAEATQRALLNADFSADVFVRVQIPELCKHTNAGWSAGARLSVGTSKVEDGTLLVWTQGRAESSSGSAPGHPSLPSVLKMAAGSLRLCLRATRRRDGRGSLFLDVYVPYVLENKTGHAVDVAMSMDNGSKTASGTPATSMVPNNSLCTDGVQALFAPPHPDERVTLSTNGLQSEPFLLNLPVGTSKIPLLGRSGGGAGSSASASAPEERALALTWDFGDDSHLWRRVWVHPMLTFVNRSPWELDVGDLLAGDAGQPDVEPNTIFHVGVDAETPVLILGKEQRWTVRLTDKTEWSVTHFKPAMSGTVTLKLSHLESGAMCLMQAQCSEVAGHRMVVLSEVTVAEPPLRIENHSKRASLVFWQKGCGNRYELEPGRMMAYAKDDPTNAAGEVLCFQVESAGGQPAKAAPPVDVTFFEPLPADVPYSCEGKERKVVVCVFVEGNTRVFLVADTTARARQVMGLPIVLTEEVVKQDLALTMTGGIGLSLVESFPVDRGLPRELVYATLTGIAANASFTTVSTLYFVVAESMQLDYQRFDAECPVTLAVKPNGRDSSTDGETPPMLAALYLVSLGQIGGRSFDSTYVSLKAQPIVVEVEGPLISELQQFVASLGSSDGGEAAALPDETAIEHRQHYAEVEIILGDATVTLKGMDRDIFDSPGLRTLGVTLLNLSAVPLQLPCVNVKNLLVTQSELVDRLTTELMRPFLRFMGSNGILKTAGSVLGSLNMLGNPLATAQTLGGGVKDFFYEPFKGAVHGPRGFRDGLAKGTKRLGGGLVGGVAGATSKITGTLGSGLSHLTFDREYQEERRRAMAKHGNLGEGMATGAKQFGRGLLSGVTGVVMQPIKGGKEGGVVGGLKGFGLGLAGLVTKPVTGVVDLVSSSLAGLESSVSGSHQAQRVRLPRFVTPTGVVEPYSAYRAFGLTFVKTKFEGRFAALDYLGHVTELNPGGSKHCYLYFFTTKNIFVVKGKDASFETMDVGKEFDALPVVGFVDLGKEGVELKLSNSGSTLLSTHDPTINVDICAILHEMLAQRPEPPKFRRGRVQPYFTPPGELDMDLASEGSADEEEHQEGGWSEEEDDEQEGEHGKQEQGPAAADEGGGEGEAGAAAAATSPAASATSRTLSAETSEVEVYENERRHLRSFGKRLLPTDRAVFSSRNGQTSYSNLDSVEPPEGFRWAGGWAVDRSIGDDEGWQFAVDFQGILTTWRDSCRMVDRVRRKRWVRKVERITDDQHV